MAKDPWMGPQHLASSGDDVTVGWIDLMGIGDAMSRSYEAAAVNVGKLYAAIANHKLIEDMNVYPMADGVYILSEEKDDLAQLMANIFYQFGDLTHERQNDPSDDYGPWLGFLIRGGIAQGTVYHGSDFDENDDSDLADVDWLDNVPFGKPIANAHHVERSSAPYSIALHESVTDNPRDWKWWDSYNTDIENKVVEYLEDHFDWAMSEIDNLLYQEENLHYHAGQAEEFFELTEGHFDLS